MVCTQYCVFAIQVKSPSVTIYSPFLPLPFPQQPPHCCTRHEFLLLFFYFAQPLHLLAPLPTAVSPHSVSLSLVYLLVHFVHSSIVYCSRDLEAAQVPISRRVDKKLGHLHNGIGLSRKKQGNLTLCNSLGAPGEHMLSEISDRERQAPHDLPQAWKLMGQVSCPAFETLPGCGLPGWAYATVSPCSQAAGPVLGTVRGSHWPALPVACALHSTERPLLLEMGKREHLLMNC